MDYGKLLSFYLACVEEEDLRNKQVKADGFNRQYIAPEADEGELFRNVENIYWNISEEQLRFIERYTGEIERPRYLYGYPVYRNNNGFILPLFMGEVEVELDQQKTNITLRLIHPGTIQVNLHLFKRTHPSLAERLALQDTLESTDFGSFEARIRKAFEERQEQYESLEELITPAGREGWKNASIVFRDTGGVYTNQLRRELEQMRKINLSKEAAGTALQTLFETYNRNEIEPPELLEIVPLNQSQRNASIAALSEPLTVITGPPGTGKSQVVINLITSMEAAGHRVLFASKNNRAVDVVREKIAEILDCDDWTLRLGNKKMIDEERQVRIEQAIAIQHNNVEMISDRGKELVVCQDCICG